MEEEEKTPEQIEQERLARAARRAKFLGNDPTPVEPDVLDNDITSIRTATPEDPTGSEEIIIDNNLVPSEKEETNDDSKSAISSDDT